MARSTMTYEERIQKMDQKEQEISEKLRQYQAKKRQLEIAKRKDDERKRVHRLIPIGEVIASYGKGEFSHALAGTAIAYYLQHCYLKKKELPFQGES